MRDGGDVVSGFIRSAGRMGRHLRFDFLVCCTVKTVHYMMVTGGGICGMIYHRRTGGCIRFWSLRGKAYRASFADVMYHVTTGDGIFHRILRRLAGAMAVT